MMTEVNFDIIKRKGFSEDLYPKAKCPEFTDTLVEGEALSLWSSPIKEIRPNYTYFWYNMLWKLVVELDTIVNGATIYGLDKLGGGSRESRIWNIPEGVKIKSIEQDVFRNVVLAELELC